MNKFFILLIHIYQQTLSPDHGFLRARYPYGFCRHFPSCSQYAVLMLQSHTMPKAIFFIVKRIVRCNPFTPISV